MFTYIFGQDVVLTMQESSTL